MTSFINSRYVRGTVGALLTAATLYSLSGCNAKGNLEATGDFEFYARFNGQVVVQSTPDRGYRHNQNPDGTYTVSIGRRSWDMSKKTFRDLDGVIDETIDEFPNTNPAWLARMVFPYADKNEDWFIDSYEGSARVAKVREANSASRNWPAKPKGLFAWLPF